MKRNSFFSSFTCLEVSLFGLEIFPLELYWIGWIGLEVLALRTLLWIGLFLLSFVYFSIDSDMLTKQGYEKNHSCSTLLAKHGYEKIIVDSTLLAKHGMQ